MGWQVCFAFFFSDTVLLKQNHYVSHGKVKNFERKIFETNNEKEKQAADLLAIKMCFAILDNLNIKIFLHFLVYTLN